MKLLSIGKLVLLFLCFFLTTFFGLEFVTRYGLDYNEVGRYFDEETSIVYHEQAIAAYGFLLLTFCFITLFVIFWIRRTRSN